MEQEKKDYSHWHEVKSDIQAKHSRSIPQFNEREIWWCAIGINIGDEEDGKHDDCERPVCVIRKFNRFGFLGAPLTTNSRNHRYRFPIHIGGKEGSVMLSQIRFFSSKRLRRKLSRIGPDIFNGLKMQIQKILS